MTSPTPAEETLQRIRALAEALAETYTSPYGVRNPDWDMDRPDGPDNQYYTTVPRADRVDQSPYIVFTAGDGGRAIRMPSCTEIAEALTPTVQALITHAEKRAAAKALRGAADAINGGPTFPLPPSVISALLRERAAELDPS